MRRVALIGTALALVSGCMAGDVSAASMKTLGQPQVGPEIRAWTQQRLEKQAQERSERRSPHSRAARVRSRAMFGGLTSDLAQDLARDSFSAWLKTPSMFIPAGLNDPDTKVLSDHSAVIERDGKRTLVEATVPLRARDAAGHLSAIDGTLVDRGALHEPRLAAINVRLSDRVTSGVAVPSMGLKVAPIGVADRPASQVPGSGVGVRRSPRR